MMYERAATYAGHEISRSTPYIGTRPRQGSETMENNFLAALEALKGGAGLMARPRKIGLDYMP